MATTTLERFMLGVALAQLVGCAGAESERRPVVVAEVGPAPSAGALAPPPSAAESICDVGPNASNARSFDRGAEEARLRAELAAQRDAGAAATARMENARTEDERERASTQATLAKAVALQAAADLEDLRKGGCGRAPRVRACRCEPSDPLCSCVAP